MVQAHSDFPLWYAINGYRWKKCPFIIIDHYFGMVTQLVECQSEKLKAHVRFVSIPPTSVQTLGEIMFKFESKDDIQATIEKAAALAEREKQEKLIASIQTRIDAELKKGIENKSSTVGVTFSQLNIDPQNLIAQNLRNALEAAGYRFTHWDAVSLEIYLK